MRYVSRPQVVEAVRWTGNNLDEISAFLTPDPAARETETRARLRSAEPDASNAVLELKAGKHGAQGWVPVPVGHWIVRLPDDLTDHWPVDPDYFANKYDLEIVDAHIHAEGCNDDCDEVRGEPV